MTISNTTTASEYCYPTNEAVSPKGLANFLYNSYPLLRSRIERAVDLYCRGAVGLLTSGLLFEVLGNSDTYVVDATDLGYCSCPDHSKAPGGLCKHAIAAGLYLAAFEELPNKKLPTIAKKAKGLPRF